jgi:predicted PurR-regulated permease PerM
MTSPADVPVTARQRVPVRAIAATIGMVLLTVLALMLVRSLSRVLVWTVIAAFFAVALYPVVDWLDRRLRRRWLATLLVFTAALIGLGALATLFVTPLVREGAQLAAQTPGYVDQVRTGQGPLGELVQRYNLDDLIARNQTRISESLSGLGAPALHILQVAAETVAGIVTIFVLAYLMVLEGPKLVGGSMVLLPEGSRQRVTRVGADCARTVTGYLSGNLLISLICGSLTFGLLLVLDVPYAGLLALFVGLADLVPLVGATLGAVVAVGAAAFQSFTAALITAVFFIVYQQAENHLLQPVILARTVQLNPLTVLLSILAGVELAGVLGALLAIPVAGIVQVIVRDVYDARRGRLKAQPTVGEDQQPLGDDSAEEAGPPGAGPGDERSRVMPSAR